MEPIRRVAPPLPGRAVLAQDWVRVTFLHWRVPAHVVAPLLPPNTRPDEFDGTSWVGLVAFQVPRTSLVPGPVLPYVGEYPEINVRLYTVDDEGRRAVLFLSLEASRVLTVLTARATVHVPYQWARMSIRRDGDALAYRSARLTGDRSSSHLVVRPSSEPVADDPLADFLTARWALHTPLWGRTRYVRMEHEPWPLRRASLVSLDDELVAAAGLAGVATRPPDSVLYSPGVHARFAGTVRPAARAGS
ncbi:YqjF family protein [Cellulomonas fengjieae]|uniref:YqjF family protein n=1 Tax=Cellulomonas fengjieae TaxID=2819978 RepID=UPI0020BE7BC2|nr:DUF2071 domain-containing protein [Cellulomonas fengjieae]